MRRILAGLAGLFGICVVGLYLLIGLRNIVMTSWGSPAEVETYTVIGEDQRTMSLTILPRNTVAIMYADLRNLRREAVLLRWRGSGGDHYGFGIWHMGDAPIFGPNIRIIPKGFIPFFMEIEVLERWGVGESSFLSPGSSSQAFVLFAEDRSSIVFEDMPLQREELDPLVALYLAQAIQDTEAVTALQVFFQDEFSAPDSIQ